MPANARNEVKALLAYAEDEAGGLMNPRFARLRPDMTIDQAIAYLRRQARTRLETIYYAYVLDAGQRPIGVVSFRDLFAKPGDRLIWKVMVHDPITVEDTLDQESVSRLIAQHNLLALPVVDGEGRMKASSPSTTRSTWCRKRPPKTSRKSAACRPSTSPTCRPACSR